ncbi:MAG: alpha/beta hydrolase [Blastocatellia bacterium]
MSAQVSTLSAPFDQTPPSWQSRLVSQFLRWRFKRRPFPTEEQNVAFVRRVTGDTRLARLRTPRGVSVQPVAASGVRGEWVWWPDTETPRTILYLHGGGYIFGSPEIYRPLMATLARMLRARVFALQYRLAPEHRFPAAIHDARQCWRMLLEQGINTDQTLLMGDSAGGGLAAALLTCIRDEALAAPRAAVLFSPWTDLAGTGASLRANSDSDAMFYEAGIHNAAGIYLGTASRTDPLASPLYADLGGLPPMLIYASDSETLLDDSIRLAEKVRQAGGGAQLRVAHRQPHVWPIMVGLMPEARAALDQVRDFAGEQLNA